MMIERLFGAATIAGLIFIAACPAYAAKLPRYGVFFYSNECVQPESGDASGGTLKLTRTPQGDTIEYGWSAEGPMESVTATNVRIEADTKISFTVPSTPSTIYEGAPHQFKGTISTSSVRLSGTSVPASIPRQKLDFKPKLCP